MATDLKGKKNLFVIAAIAVVVIIILIIAFFPKGEKEEQGAQVITKRVKLNLIDETVNVGENHMDKAEADAAHATEPANGPEPVKAEEARAVTPAPEPVKIVPAPVKTEAGKAAPVAKAAPKKTQTASISKVTLAARKPWAINVASFPDGEGARMLEKSLDAAGYNAYITHFSKDGIDWNRVRVGFYASKEEAQRSGEAIKRQYKVQSPWIVMPTKEETSRYIR